LRVVKRSGELRVSGLQFPARPGSEIVVSLLRRQGGRFVRVDRDRVDLGKRRDPDGDGFAESGFSTRFDRPGSGRCKVVAKQPATPGFGSSKATKKFRC